MLAPNIGAATTKAFTVTTAVILQVLTAVYVTVAVPVETPYTRPDGLIVAVPTGLIVHDVPDVASERNVTEPTPHTARLPRIGVGIGFTVTL